MSATYYTLVTDIGNAKLTNALALGQAVTLTHFAVGDGNGAAYDPVQSQTALAREVYRAAINAISVDEANPTWLTVEAVVPATEGGWTIREAGVFDEDGDLIAIAKYPESVKPALAEGVGKDLYLRLILEYGNVETVTLKIDPAIVLATREYVGNAVEAAMAGHAEGTDHAHPDASTTTKGMVELATPTETKAGTSVSLAVTPKGLADTLADAITDTPLHGQCRLVLDGANLRLAPSGGDRLIIGGESRTIPAGGVALAPTGTAEETLYYIYAAYAGDAVTLEASTTGHSLDAASGIEVKAGDVTRTLVGMAYCQGAGAWPTSEVLVASWFNRHRRKKTTALPSSTSTTSTTLVELSSAMRLPFVTWGIAPVEYSVVGTGNMNTGGSAQMTTIRFDGGTRETSGVYTGEASPGFDSAQGFSGSKDGLAEGYHYAGLWGAVVSGTGSWYPASTTEAVARIGTQLTITTEG